MAEDDLDRIRAVAKSLSLDASEATAREALA
jgi:hypothetical protein